MTIEIVSFPNENGDLNHSYISHYQRLFPPLNPITNHHVPMVFLWFSYGFPRRITQGALAALAALARRRAQVIEKKGKIPVTGRYCTNRPEPWDPWDPWDDGHGMKPIDIYIYTYII